MGTEPHARGAFWLPDITLPRSRNHCPQPYLFYDEKMPYDAAQAMNEANR